MIVPDLRDGYVEIVQTVLRDGRETSPRGYRTWEIEDATVVITDTRRLLPVGVGRDPKIAIGAAEALLLCGGLDSPSLFCSVSKTFRRFLDGGVLLGTYGRRVRGQMETVIRRLRQDHDTRQAIVEIYDPTYDQVDSRDIPCTLGFGFRIRNGELHMSARMRSQDAFLGLCYDAFFFGQLGHTVANVLGIEFTRLCIKQDSLHVYERNLEAIERLHPVSSVEKDYHDWEPAGFGYSEYGGLDEWTTPVGGVVSQQNLQYELYRRRAEMIYNRGVIEAPPLTESEAWYKDVLDPFDRLTSVDNFSS